MVRFVFAAVAITAVLGCVEGFAPTFGVSKSASTVLCATKAEVRKDIASITADNFSDTLKKLEPFLTEEAGSTMYAKSMRRIARAGKALNKDVPEGYAKEAKCTEKKRSKQDAFIQTKEEERIAAEEEAAAEATAAKEAAAAEADAAKEAAAAEAATAEEEPAAE